MLACQIGWRPGEFWDVTPVELFVAIDAWNRMNNPEAAEEQDRRAKFRQFREKLEAAGVA
jgi:hypothetical protein